MTTETRHLILETARRFGCRSSTASSLININTVSTTTADQALLNNLPLTQQEIDSLLDWTSTSTTARTDGAKDDYYNALPTPYNTKLGTLSTLSELLLIQGWVGVDLYGTTNTNGGDAVDRRACRS